MLAGSTSTASSNSSSHSQSPSQKSDSFEEVAEPKPAEGEARGQVIFDSSLKDDASLKDEKKAEVIELKGENGI